MDSSRVPERDQPTSPIAMPTRPKTKFIVGSSSFPGHSNPRQESHATLVEASRNIYLSAKKARKSAIVLTAPSSSKTDSDVDDFAVYDDDEDDEDDEDDLYNNKHNDDDWDGSSVWEDDEDSDDLGLGDKPFQRINIEPRAEPVSLIKIQIEQGALSGIRVEPSRFLNHKSRRAHDTHPSNIHPSHAISPLAIPIDFPQPAVLSDKMSRIMMIKRELTYGGLARMIHHEKQDKMRVYKAARVHRELVDKWWSEHGQGLERVCIDTGDDADPDGHWERHHEDRYKCW